MTSNYTIRMLRVVRHTSRQFRSFGNQQIHSKSLTKDISFEKNQPIAGFYNKKSVLITGGTGFLGKVSIVFHCAATVKFNEPLSVALNINVEGTRKLLNLCDRMKNIQAFIHISTAYSNADRRSIDEVVYPAPADACQIRRHLQQYGDDERKNQATLNRKPNTYTFTKAIAENVVKDHQANFSKIIVRPSMVKASKNEPIPGWVDSWSVPSALMTSVALGINRVIIGKKDNIVDFIPVDYVVNLSIAAAAKCDRYLSRAKYNSYNSSCTSACKPIKLEECFSLFTKEGKRHRFSNLHFPGAIYLENKYLVGVITFLLQTIPAHLADIWLWLLGRKPRLAKYNSKIVSIRHSTQYFTSNSWVMTSHNSQRLFHSLNSEDQKLFPFNPNDIDWKTYMPVHFRGVQKYLLDEKLDKDGESADVSFEKSEERKKILERHESRKIKEVY